MPENMSVTFSCRRLRRSSLALAAALLVGGCALASVGEGPPADLYVLTSPDPTPSGTSLSDTESTGMPGAASIQILVEKPDAPAEIDSSRIAFQPTPNEVRYFADARWVDRAPNMVQRLIAETLEKSGKFQAVSRKAAGRRHDFALAGELRTFTAVPGDGGAPVVRIVLNMTVIDQSDRSVVASRVFEATARAPAAQTREVVRAFDLAFGEILRALSRWTVRSVVGPQGGQIG